jgi:NhaP-type Na+/H+ or K+/H+ antiporter
VQGLENAEWYVLAVAALLAVGLYASTFGIDLKEARKHVKIILSAVTVGVLLKAVIIGGSLTLIFQDPFFLILGITVAQIDPLSVASLMKGNRLSARAKTILASWASFDDPVTVIMSLYAPLLIVQFTDISLGSIAGDSSMNAHLISYIKEISLNVGLAAQAFCLYTVIRYYAKQISAWLAFGVSLSIYALLAVVFSVSLLYFMMLGIALVGLFLRPPKLDKAIDHAVTWALRAAAVLLGFLLISGINLWSGIMLGVAAYAAQIIAGFVLTRGLPKKDRWHIAFAQQNGITAIILALLFEPIHPGTVAIVAPAIIVVNTLHGVVNKILDTYVLRDAT